MRKPQVGRVLAAAVLRLARVAAERHRVALARTRKPVAIMDHNSTALTGLALAAVPVRAKAKEQVPVRIQPMDQPSRSGRAQLVILGVAP
jgi:hypothetical protein